MKKIIPVLLVIIPIVFTKDLQAQNSRTFELGFENTETVKLKRGDTFLCNRDGAYVLNPAAARKLYGMLEKDSLIIADLEKQKEISGMMLSQKDSIISRLNNIIEVQNTAYTSLNGLQNETSSLVKQSVENTNRALSYAKQIKFASYLTGAAAGAVAGGLLDSKIYRFGPMGAILGAAGGIAINYLIQEVLIGD